MSIGFIAWFLTRFVKTTSISLSLSFFSILATILVFCGLVSLDSARIGVVLVERGSIFVLAPLTKESLVRLVGCWVIRGSFVAFGRLLI
jgi:CBS-domain-containing membrane protein